MNEPAEGQRLVFVVHKHQARTLHYGVRLEIGGVMRTSAIPKGPTLDPQLKRQASPTTDHTLEYRHFEGVLEEGQEGAGPVMVWDEGTSTPQREMGKGVLVEVSERAEAEALMRASAGSRPAEIPPRGTQAPGLVRIGSDPGLWQKGELAANPRAVMAMR